MSLIRRVATPLLIALLAISPAVRLAAQVTTATLYGEVHDSTGAVVPRATVTATNQGTGVTRDAVADDSGEFALVALPAGRYTVRIESAGFKTYNNKGLDLGAGQTARLTFPLEVGQVSDNVTVSESATLVETASATQKEALGSQQATELPLARRNLLNLVTLAPGTSDASVGIAGGGNIRLNGVAEGGNAITVDGTDAMANPETRGMSQYGGQSQLSIMSIEAVAEVQVIKGILPSEYGGVVGGQVNFITRSGTNQFHGSALETYQNEAFFARDRFLPATSAKPKDRFSQFGGSLGGPILRNRLFFFSTYEGYRETAGVVLTATVPTQQLRDQILTALPFPETRLALAPIPLPTQTISANSGQYTTAKLLTRHENHALVKGDAIVYGGNLSVTYSRMRPYTLNPQYFLNGANDQQFQNSQDRIAVQYVKTRGAWVSETRFGWNKTGLDRQEQFWFTMDPAHPNLPPLTSVGRRIPEFNVPGIFASPGQESLLALHGRSYSMEQKLSRVLGKHLIKMGANWGRQGGTKTNPEIPNMVFQNVSDLLANIPSSVVMQSGQPPHDGHLDEFGGFIQDDWRVNKRLVLNLGMRYDYYPTVHFEATTNAPAEIYNLAPPTSLQALDFGAPVDPSKPYNPDRTAFGPRVGFAWSLDSNSKTVIRGGSGILYSQQLFAMLQNTVSNPFLPATVQLNKTDLISRGIKWPDYGEDVQNQVIKSANGKPIVYSLIDTHIRNPYTIQTMVDVERSLGGAWMLEVGYFRTDGKNFPLHDPLAQAFDRQTGSRPNPLLAASGGYYITSGQTMVYNGLQSSIRKRFSSNLALDFHYTLESGWADQGGALASNFVNSDIYVTQDFFHPYIDREPLSQQVRNRVAANGIYELPWLRNGKNLVSKVAGGWQVSSTFQARSGQPLRLTQASGIAMSRPDYLGGDPVAANYRTTLSYFNKAVFAQVPTYAATGATVRAGTQNPADVHGPGFVSVNVSLAKTFSFRERFRLELRGDWLNAFNHVNYSNPNLAITSPSFGLITSDVAPRSGQVSARFTF